MKKPLVVNLLGPPGSGKSTMAANIFAELKWAGIECELVSEFAKDLTWEERFNTLENQLYVFAKQFHKMYKLNNKVDVIITDSPLLLSMYYNDKHCGDDFTQLNPLVLEQHHKFNNLNILVNRVKEYNPNGRNQTEGESDLIGTELKTMLDLNNIKYHEIDGTKENIHIIVNHIQYLLNGVD